MAKQRLADATAGKAAAKQHGEAAAGRRNGRRRNGQKLIPREQLGSY
jgi:hypothetical protein